MKSVKKPVESKRHGNMKFFLSTVHHRQIGESQSSITWRIQSEVLTKKPNIGL